MPGILDLVTVGGGVTRDMVSSLNMKGAINILLEIFFSLHMKGAINIV